LLPCPTANGVVHSRRLAVCATIASTRGPSHPQKARASCFAGFPNPIHVSRNTPGFRCLAAPVTVPSPPVRESNVRICFRYLSVYSGKSTLARHSQTPRWRAHRGPEIEGLRGLFAHHEMPRSSKLDLRVELKSQSDPRHHRIKLTALRSSTPRDAPGASRTPVQHVIRPLT
jgi:hypothetical protein